MQISGLSTLTGSTVHIGSEVHACKSMSELPTNVGTSDVRSQSTSKASGVGTPDKVRDFRLAQTAGQQSHRYQDSWLGSGLPTSTVTAQAK